MKQTKELSSEKTNGMKGIDDEYEREVGRIFAEISEDYAEEDDTEMDSSKFKLNKALAYVKDAFNYCLEMVVSKTLARLFIGTEVDGPLQYKVAGSGSRRTNHRTHDENNIIRVETSVTLDTRKDAWGLERIVSDTTSNHLPDDSGGTKVNIEYLQEGVWNDFRYADREKTVEAIRISDDGKGFDHRLLELLYSTKTKKRKAVGQFGEGIKLVSAACLRKGIKIEYRSRDWSAKPYTVDIVIEEEEEKEEIQRLCFEKRIGLPKIKGSKTIIYSPTKDLVLEFNALSEKMLEFNDRHRAIFSEDYNGYIEMIMEMFDRREDMPTSEDQHYCISEDQFIFVKRVRIESATERKNLLFSYDLGIEEITPDRQFIDIEAAKRNIRKLLLKCKDVEIYEDILSCASSYPDEEYLEYVALEEVSKPDEIDFDSWRKAFHSLFGDNAILESKHLEADIDAEGMYGYRIINLNPRLKNFLHKNGIIKDSKDLLERRNEFEWSKDLTQEESDMLDLIKSITKIPFVNNMLGLGDITPNVRVYDGLYMVSYNQDGKEVCREAGPKSNGFYLKEDPLNSEQDLIAINRGRLSSFDGALSTYVHELGHKMTGARDYDRKFVNYFTAAIKRAIIQYVSEELKNNN